MKTSHAACLAIAASLAACAAPATRSRATASAYPSADLNTAPPRAAASTNAEPSAVDAASTLAPREPITRYEPLRSAPLPQEGNEPYDLEAGNVEVSVFGSGLNDEDFEVGSAALGIAVNAYINDSGTAVALRQILSFADSGPGSDTWDGSTRVGVQQTFELGRLMPYAGLLIGRTYGDSIQELWTGGPEAGIKWYVKDEAFLLAGVEYQVYFDSDDRVGDAFEDGTFYYQLGFGLRF